MKIKIIRPVTYSPEYRSSHMNISMIPPLGMPMIVAYLKKNGVSVEQDDLNIRAHYMNFRRKPIDFEIFNKKNLVLEYLAGNSTPLIENQINRIMTLTDYDAENIFFTNVGHSFELFKENFLLCACKYLKLRGKTIGIGGQELENIKLFRQYNLIDNYFPDGDEVMLARVLGKKTSKTKEILAPDFNGLPMELYRWRPSNVSRGILLLPYMTSTGCPNSCIYCPESTSRFNGKPIKDVISDLRQLTSKYNTKHVYFLDNTLNSSRKRIIDICKGMIQAGLNISWSASVSFKNLDERCLDIMRTAGCVRLVYGLESASMQLLKMLNKKIYPSEASRLLKYADSIGIWNYVNLIVGFPVEKADDYLETIHFIRQNHRCIDSISVEAFFYAKKSLLARHPETYGLFNIKRNFRDSFSEYDKSRQTHKYGNNWSKTLKKKQRLVKELFRILKLYNIYKSEEPVPYESLFYIFYLDSICRSKKDLKARYKKIMSRILMKKIFHILSRPRLAYKYLNFKIRGPPI